ncbi:MAG: septum formation initiator family protein [Proteiniclasticum sp.]|uniref:septum formation initiator family protein n=1 Tax=Proteiniclasticum ruminis TaxID=398199 RepID=UPI001B461DD1|nr:septum formation initiator family protein [Proteiniclasticum ruminis]MBP9920811.1 septum formation initiator family protein [Proteiniclasticum sp.]
MRLGKFLIRLLLILFVGIISLTVYKQQVMMAHIRENMKEESIKLEKVMEENEKLANLVDSIGTEDYTIRSARTRLGLLRPGEVPVIDSSGN